jgi:TolA-binding protein
MDCETVERENIPERYLAGALDAPLKEQWEQHYFACDRCAELLATWQAIDRPLRQRADAIRRESLRPKPSARWLWAGAAIAAAVAIGVGVEMSMPRQKPQVAQVVAPAPVNPWLELARLDPPAYQPNTFRGAGSKADAQFQAAMEAYLRRDYAQAATGLRAALELDPDAAASRFFLGACDLLTGDSTSGVRELERVASGDSPFAQEARFDLAKGHLQQNDPTRAMADLRQLTDVPGDFQEPARQLLARVSAAR